MHGCTAMLQLRLELLGSMALMLVSPQAPNGVP